MDTYERPFGEVYDDMTISWKYKVPTSCLVNPPTKKDYIEGQLVFLSASVDQYNIEGEIALRTDEGDISIVVNSDTPIFCLENFGNHTEL